MRFLEGGSLTNEMRRLVQGRDAIKIAIAYWGSDALSRLKINPKRENMQILCCLKGGKSAPEVIEQFGAQARQNHKLHAKVIWTPSEAIVGSANASSNGLPEEEKAIDGLIEAGVHINGPQELSLIESWFDNLYQTSQPITKADLEAATEARAKRFSSRGNGKRELVDIPINELKKMKLAVLVWSGDFATAGQNRKVGKLFPAVSASSFFHWYLEGTSDHVPNYPWQYETLTFRAASRDARRLPYGGLETFGQREGTKKINIRAAKNTVIPTSFVERSSLALREFKIGKVSIDKIRARLKKKKLKLAHDLYDGPDSFVSWEPLYKLLA